MKKQMTLMAMSLAAVCSINPHLPTSHQNHIDNCNKSLGSSPLFMPSKSQRVKNKLNRKRYA